MLPILISKPVFYPLPPTTYRLLRMINIMAAIISAADIICMGFMAVSQGRWIGYLDSERANLAVTWVQSVVLFGERSR